MSGCLSELVQVHSYETSSKQRFKTRSSGLEDLRPAVRWTQQIEDSPGPCNHICFDSIVLNLVITIIQCSRAPFQSIGSVFARGFNQGEFRGKVFQVWRQRGNLENRVFAPGLAARGGDTRGNPLSPGPCRDILKTLVIGKHSPNPSKSNSNLVKSVQIVSKSSKKWI